MSQCQEDAFLSDLEVDILEVQLLLLNAVDLEEAVQNVAMTAVQDDPASKQTEHVEEDR